MADTNSSDDDERVIERKPARKPAAKKTAAPPAAEPPAAAPAVAVEAVAPPPPPAPPAPPARTKKALSEKQQASLAKGREKLAAAKLEGKKQGELRAELKVLREKRSAEVLSALEERKRLYELKLAKTMQVTSKYNKKTPDVDRATKRALKDEESESESDEELEDEPEPEPEPAPKKPRAKRQPAAPKAKAPSPQPLAPVVKRPRIEFF